MMKAPSVAIYLVIATLAACADLKNELRGTAKPDGGIALDIPQTQNFEASFDRTWKATVDILDKHSILYEADKAGGKIVTEDKELQKISGWRAFFYGSNYKAKQFIDLKRVGETRTAVQHRARFTKEFATIFATTNKEYPEAENLLRKTFFDELSSQLGAAASQPLGRTSSAPAQPTFREVKAAETIQGASPEPLSIADLQRRLSELGYQPGGADGIMGKRTVEALRSFQKDKRLPVTGHADGETISELRAAKRN
jgi:Putative peptidoglycan binding domain